MSLVPYPAALERVLGRIAALDHPAPADLPISEVVGLVTAVAVTAPEAVPPFDNSAVDGFAVRASDVAEVPVELSVVATIPAGAAPDVRLGAGQCARIMTGAMVPVGADAVVMVEQTEPVDDPVGDPPSGAGEPSGPTEGPRASEGPRSTGRVRILSSGEPGRHIRPRGDDLDRGAVAIPAGTVIRPTHVGLAATVGCSTVTVHPRPRVGVISTGDELVGPDADLAPGQIRDSNRQMLLALCDRGGFEAVDLGLIRDDLSAIEAALLAAAESCDAILTSGGVSMGDFDYVKAVLGRIGDMEWMQVAIKPAKPFAFGVIGRTPVFGLPGNPVSSLVSFELFARPGLRALAGYPDPQRLRLPGIAGESLVRRRDGRTHFVRVTLERAGDRLIARSTGGQGSHQLAASAAADALAVVPDGEGIAAGEPVELLLIG